MNASSQPVKAGWSSGWLPALAALAAGWALAFGMLELGLRRTDQIDRANYDGAALAIRELLETQMERFEGALGRMATFGMFQPSATTGAWLELLDSIDPVVNFKHAGEFGAAKYTADFGLSRAEAEIPAASRKYRWATVTFRAVGPSFEPGPTGDELLPTDPKDAIPLAEAVKTGAPRLGGPFRALNDAGGGTNVFVRMYLAYYTPSHVHASPRAPAATNESLRMNKNALIREGRFAGLVFGTVKLDALVRSSFGEKRLPVEFELHAGPGRSSKDRVDGRPFAADGTSRIDGWSDQSWYTCRYRYRCYTTPEFEAQSPRRLVLALAGSVALVALVLAAFVRSQTLGRQRAESLAALREEGRMLLRSVGDERERLSRDLHDGAVQAMYAVVLTLKRAMGEADPNSARVRENLGAAVSLLDGAIAELRALLISLAPSPLAGEALANALGILASTMSRANSMRVVLDGDTAALQNVGPQAGVEVLNLLREAISNAIRHSGADLVTVAVGGGAGPIRLTVRDGGCGFDPARVTKAGHGLGNMEARAARMGASLQIESAPGRGTTIRLTLPAGREWQPSEEP